MRRHLAALVDAGLIERRDSPNGKRYAHRGRGGEIEAAFGFSLAPLLARAAEIANLAQQVAAERLRFKRAKEALSLCRRDVRKLISAAMEEGADGDWATIEAMFIGLLARLSRSPQRKDVDAVLEEMELLREEIINRLEIQLKTEKRTSMTTMMTVTYTMQIPNPPMNLNLALEKSRARCRARNRNGLPNR